MSVVYFIIIGCTFNIILKIITFIITKKVAIHKYNIKGILYIIYNIEIHRMMCNYKINNLNYNFMEQNYFSYLPNMLKIIVRYFDTCMPHDHELFKLRTI